MDNKRNPKDECGRILYHGTDMAYIYINGDLMFTMSEVWRNLYPKWRRTTLNDRVKRMKIRWYTCTPSEIEKVLSVQGIAKYGIHCTLISKLDLDMFTSVYKIGFAPENKRRISGKQKQNKNIVGSVKDSMLKLNKSVAVDSDMSPSRSEQSEFIAKVEGGKQSSKTRRKSSSRAHVRNNRYSTFKIENDKTHNEMNKGICKQTHVFIKAQNNEIHEGRAGLPKKRKLIARSLENKNKNKNERQDMNYEGWNSAKRRCANVTRSDYHSCSSSPSLESKAVFSKKLGSLTKLTKHKTFKAIERVKKNYNKHKTHKPDQKIKQTRKETRTKNEIKKKAKKTKNQKLIGQSCENNLRPKTITKDQIMKMDLKDLNEKYLIDSLSPSTKTGSNKNSPSNPQSYEIKLMPVKPVWKVNTNFRFISNFQLPPYLTIRDGELSPACSMICRPGKKPPSAHPIWKWKIGEPVIGNKTEISYRVKRVKCG